MYLTLRVPSVAVAVSPPLPPLYVGTRLTEAVLAAIKGSKEYGVAVFFVEQGKDVIDANCLPILTAPHRSRGDVDITWLSKAAETECNKRGLPGIA